MAISQYYVDPLAGVDAPGGGAIGAPWKTTQYALNTIVRNAVDGDQVNIKAGAADVLGATLSIGAYGTPSAAAPLILRGYTAAAYDGGRGCIDGAASFSIWTTNVDYFHLIDLELRNVGNRALLSGIQNYCLLLRCDLHGNTGSNGVLVSGPSRIIGCWFHDLTGGNMFYSSSNCVMAYCFMDSEANPPTVRMMGQDGPGSVVVGNIIRIRSGAGVNGIYMSVGLCLGNTVVHAGGGTGKGIEIGLATVCLNNVVQGFSGVGGVGIVTAANGISMIASNAAFNNTTNFSIIHSVIDPPANNDALALTPFVDISANDFDINGTIAGVTEDAYALAFLGAAATTPKPDKGAVQAGAGVGGAVSISPYRGNL